MKDIYEKVISTKNLYSAWDKIKTIANEEYLYNSYELRNFNENLDSIILSLQHLLKHDNFQFESLHTLQTPKKDGGKRIFHISSLTNMLVTQAIINVIGQTFESQMINESYGYRLDLQSNLEVYKDWSIQYNDFSSNLLKWNDLYGNNEYTIIKYDLRGFFDNINIANIFAKLTTIIKDGSLCNLLNKYLNINTCGLSGIREKGLPQGVYSSGFFANIYLAEFDKIIKAKAIGYARYVDDLFILVESANVQEIKNEIDSELSRLKLEPNNSKYDEVSINDYYKLQNMINKLKYETSEFIETQSSVLTDTEKVDLLNYFESNIVGKKDVPIDKLEDYTDHINYLLFLNNKLTLNDRTTLYISLQVLKQEPIKYNKLERIYNNLFYQKIASDMLLAKICDYPDYIKLSLAKFLLKKNEYKYDESFVQEYLYSDNYLLVISGIMLAIRSNYSFSTDIIFNKSFGKEVLHFVLKYTLKCMAFESKDLISEELIKEFFINNAYCFLLYMHRFCKYPAIGKSVLIESYYTDILTTVYYSKIFFSYKKPEFYELMRTIFDKQLVLEILKQEIVFNLVSPQENLNNNIMVIVDIYKEVEFSTDDLSKDFIKELEFYINDYQISNNVLYISLTKEVHPFIEDIQFESKICRIIVEGNDVEYWQVNYDNKKYVLEKIKKDYFKNQSTYNKYINYLHTLKDNGLTTNFVDKHFVDYKYIYILYEIDNFDNLLWSKLKNDIPVDINTIFNVAIAMQKINNLISEPYIASIHNILIQNNEIRFVCLLSQFKHSSYFSCYGYKRDISVHKGIESVGYLIIDSFHSKRFLEITKENNYHDFFLLPHIGSLLNKIFSKDKDYSYKNLNLLVDDIKYIDNFNSFIKQLKEEDAHESRQIIALDYVGYRIMQYKRYLDSKDSNFTSAFTDSFEKIIRNFNAYLDKTNLYFKKYRLKTFFLYIYLLLNKVNIYTISIIIFIFNLYENSKRHLCKHRDKYGFSSFLEFINFSYYISCHAFEIETRMRIDDELAVTTSAIISKELYNKTKSHFDTVQHINNANFVESNNMILYNSNFYSVIKNFVKVCCAIKLKERYYGELLINGLALCDTNEETVYAKLKKGIHTMKQSVGIDKIDAANRHYLKLCNNPKMSIEYHKREILNINIESIAVSKYFERKKPRKELNQKFKTIFWSLIKIIFWSTILGSICYYLTKSITGTIITIFTMIIKELISPHLTKIKKLLSFDTNK